MITSHSLDRKLSSAGASGSRPFSPYSRPLTTGGTQQQDKSTLLWKDFLHSVSKRKSILERFAEAALGSSTPLPVLKKTLIELRQITLAIVEDALELEYQTRVASSSGRSSSKKGSRGNRLPPINTYNTMHDHEEIYALTEMINDCEELFGIPNVKVMLPVSFPSIRNPFMLGKTIDELATIVPPHPEPGNVEDELKSLELLRFKRASRALLRAEAQILNRLPLNLYEIERLLNRMKDDNNVEVLIRCVCTLIDNDRVGTVDQEADLTCLLSPLFTVEAHELLRKLNEYRGVNPMRVDVKVLIKQKLRVCNFDYLMEEMVPKFLLEWIQVIIGGNDSPQRQEYENPSFHLDQPSHQLQRESTISRQGVRSSYSRSTGLNNLASVDQIKSYQKDENDLTSVVDSTTGHVKTHENIHSPSEPRRKVKMKPAVQEMSQQTYGEKERSIAVGGETMDHVDDEDNVATSKKTLHFQSPKKDKVGMTNANDKRINISIKQKIRQEVEKAIKEMSKTLNPIQRNTDFGDNGDDSYQPGNFDALSSVRYELNKMQQELLRRQVLDPRHYTVTSVDAITHAKRGLTVDNLNAFDPLQRRTQQVTSEQSLMPVEIASKIIKVPQTEDSSTFMSLLNTIILRPETNDLLCTVSLSYDDAVKYGFIKDESSTSLRVNRSAQILIYFTVSPLIFSKLNTEYTIQDLIETKPEHRKRLMQNIFEQMDKICRILPLPRGSFVLPLDRSLFTKQFAEDNVLVDLLISRNLDCNGLQVQCTPIAGLFGAGGIGPVTITISDYELEVLLISQHGLFDKGKQRWDSMAVIANWIAGRLHVRKVLTNTSIEVLAPKPAHSIANDLESVASQLTYENEDAANAANTLTTKNMTTTYKGKDAITSSQSLLMLEVYIDRHIDISTTLIDHWKSRNVAKILGLDVSISARQDLETMEILVTILVPSKLTHKKLLDEQDIQHADEKGGKKKKGLLTFDTYSSDDDEDEYAYEEDNTTEIKLSYRLTRAELLIFGSTELIENHMKIGMSKNATHTPQIQENATTAVEILQENHPEKMMWNILNRLKINFKGSKDNPFKASASAKDIENWSVVYDRLLVRDVKTVSQMILMLSAAAIGSDILLEARPVDTNFKHPIGKKIVSEGEVKEMVYSEGWEIKLLEYKLRKDLSALLLDKLKIVQEASATSTDKLSKEYRIELSSYVENRMILITRIGAPPNHHKKGKDVPDVDHELELGYVEINNHHTLSDLRIVIKHELDSDDLPTQYRFLYKGTVCSLRQETFRRAWECLPTCYITPKAIMTSEAGVETEDIAKRRMEKIVKKEGPKMLRLTKSQRRAPGKYVPVPLPTLCIVEEGKSTVYLLNEAKELLTPGDIIRLGHPKGRDYIVIKIGITIPLDEQQNLGSNQGDDINLKAIEIEPEYDLISEPDFSIPIFKNSPYPNNPKTNGLYMNEKGKIIKLLKSKEAMGYRYQIPKQMIKAVYPEAVQSKKMSKFQKKASLKGKLIQSKSTLGKLASDEDDNFLNTTTGDEFDNNSDYDSNTSNANQNVGDKVLIARSLKDNKQKSLKGVKNLGSRIYTDVWIWRCIPAKEDTRPKWRQLYDDGEVRYSYEFGQSDEFFEHFRIKAYYSYLEILCTDARCSYLSLYAQRVNEMKNIPVEYYMKLIFEKLTNWSPVYKQGIERTKFIKLIRDVNAFPDLKRPARLAQIDNYFQKIVKTPAFGIVQKYVSFSGFCQLVKELSVIRFPPKKNKDGNNNPKDGDANAGTVAATSAGNTKSEGVGPDAVAENNNEDDASVMTDDISSIASGDNNANKDKNRVRPRRFGMPGASTNSSETGDANANNNNPMNVLANIDPEYIQQAYQKFILDYLMMYPNWYDEPWKEVKLVAMQKESIRYCAVTRIIATYRGFHRKKLYRFFLRQHTKLQAQIRRKLTQKWYRGVVRLLVEDYLYRQRYYYMTKIQSIVRRFIKRCWYSHVLEQLKRQQIILLRARRQKKKKINEIRKKGLMYSEVKKMNGVTVLIRVYRRDPRNYTKDFGINVEAYIPKTQAVFKFPIEDPELRSYLQILLEKPALSSGDILSKQNIKDLLITRLIVLKGSNKFTLPTIIFSRHALGQKGEKILTHAISILKEYFICKIFETIEDITVQCYHQKTSKIFTAKITIKELHRWIRDEFITETVLIRNKEKQKLLEAQGASITGFGKKITTKKPILLNSIALATSDLNSQAGDSTAEIVAQREKAKSKNKMEVDINAVPDPNGDTVSVVTTDDNATLSAEEELFQIKTLEPYLLKAENKKKYYEWILRHLVIDTRNRRFQVLFKNQLEKSRKKEMLIKIQAAWRRALVPPVVIALLDEVYLKVRSSPEEPDAYYYINRLTGVSSWDKPKLLRHYELPTQPVVSRWVPMYYQQDGIVYTHYVNPFTGKYTHLIPDQAAKVIQRLARRYLLKVIRMPKDHFIKAAGIYMTAEQLYETSYNPLMERRKLSHVINYAIVLHVLDCKEAEAKEVYREAVELSESNPLVTRCYAFFLISTCEPPMLLNRDRALLLLGDAKRKDDDHSRFTIAHYLFELAVLRQPTNYVTLVNLALVNCLIYNNNYKAEKLLRRALAVAPFEERVMEIWKWLKDRFPERVLLYNPMSRINRMKASVDEAVKKAGKELKIIHGRPVVENDQWAGWVYVPDDKFKASKTIKDKLPYWYNPADGAESLDPPDFIEQWRIRKERSHYQVTEYGLEQYFDPLTSAYFQYHPLTDTYS